MVMDNMKRFLTHPVFALVSKCADSLGVETYVVGGFVRDIFLNRPNSDIDIVVVGSGIALAEEVAKEIGSHTQVSVFKNFGTAMLHYQGMEVEFVGARKESYRADSRKPIVENGTLEEDQNRRDFTINAMALCLNADRFGELIDPFDGQTDLKKKCIRTPLEPNATFSDDPLRMMRAIRFASQLNFQIVPETFEGIKATAQRISIVSQERIIEEFNKIMLSKRPSVGINLMDKTGLLQLVFPKLAALKGVEVINGKGHKDVYLHTLEVVDKIASTSNNLWLVWAALLHDIAKPATKKYVEPIGWTFHNHEFIGSKMVPSIFKELHLPMNEKMKYVKKMVSLHLRPIALVEDCATDSAVRRLLFDAGEDIDDLMLLCEADITSKNKEKVHRYLKNFVLVREKLKEIEEKDRIRNWQPPVSGELIMETFGLKPCREVGLIKNAIREAILDGIIGNTYEEAFNLMMTEAQKLGLTRKE